MGCFDALLVRLASTVIETVIETVVDKIEHKARLERLEELKKYPEYSITCPSCHKSFTHRLGDHENDVVCYCAFCNWEILLGYKARVIGGFPRKLICVKCKTHIKYNDAHNIIACSYCDMTYVNKREQDMLEFTCTRCDGTGKTGLFFKHTCEKCDGNKILSLRILK